MSYNQLPPGYDAWKLAYPPYWDDEPEEEESEEDEPETFSGLTQCLDCHHFWDADAESTCEKCGSDTITAVRED